jgi:hypothetical protein
MMPGARTDETVQVDSIDGAHAQIEQIQTEATVRGSGKVEIAEKVCAYLENKSPCLDNATALQRGRPIATGIIEGACRHSPDQGQAQHHRSPRSPPGPEAVLKLRALIRKGDFEPYLAWHLQREHQRNHQARYQDKLSLAA